MKVAGNGKRPEGEEDNLTTMIDKMTTLLFDTPESLFKYPLSC